MIDGEIYTRECGIMFDAIFAYRYDAEYLDSGCSITHYACVMGSDVFVRNYDGSHGIIGYGPTRIATEQEIEKFVDALREYGFHYNKANKKVININTGELL